MPTFRGIAAQNLDYGIVFDFDSLRTETIREGNAYGGLRVRLIGRIDSARCSLQVDVSFGEAVTPEAIEDAYPALLLTSAREELPRIPLATCPAE
jgi:hypothetical protein